jgi:cobalt-zinc-cadmium efflux system membrane fusion protein
MSCNPRAHTSLLATVRFTRPFSALAAGLVLFAAMACGGKTEEAEAGPDSAKVVVGAQTAVASSEPFTETLGAIGVVSARPGHIATLSAPAPTRVAKVYVAVGQRVAPGEPLVELEQSGFRAAAQGAAAAVTAAEQAAARATRLANEGIVPRKDAEQAAAELAKARSDLVAAQRSLELSVMRSPIGGVVTRLDATLGASVDVSAPLVEVADPKTLDVVLSVTPSDAARVRPGATVALREGQDASGVELGSGTAADIAATVDSVTRSVAVRVRAPATRRTLRIGETVFGQIAVSVREGAVTVPVEALVPEGDGLKVFVVDEKGVAHARPVTVGGKTSKIAMIASGLAAGERVVTYGAYGVEDGAVVMEVKQ